MHRYQAQAIWLPVAITVPRNGSLAGLKKNTSSGVKTKMRLTPIHIRLIASLPTTSLLHERDSIIVQLGTLGAFWQSELISLDVCDWLTNQECDSRGQSYGAMVFQTIPAKKWGDTEIAERGRSVLVMRTRYRSAGLTLHQRGWTDAG